MTGLELGHLVIACEQCGQRVRVPIMDAEREDCPDGIYVYLRPDVTEILVHELMHDIDYVSDWPDGGTWP